MLRGLFREVRFSAGVMAGLKRDGLEGPKGHLVGAGRVVTLAGSQMGWNEVPSPGANCGVARDDIRKRMEQLVTELAAQHHD